MPKPIIFLFFYFFSGIIFAADPSWKSLSLVNGCQVLDMSGNLIRNFPGGMCLFLEDGSFVSADNQFMRLFNSKNEIQWSIPGFFHHQINLSLDKKKILAISSQPISYKKEKIREDIFLIVDMDGKILFEQKSSNLLSMANLEIKLRSITPAPPPKEELKHELSHFNSFYEIPPLSLKKMPPWLKQGRYILNSAMQGFFIANSELTALLHHHTFKISKKSKTHDVQINTKGNFLFYNNEVADLSTQTRYSALYEYNLITNSIVHSFSSFPKAMFYAPFMGGIQEIGDDLWLFSHVFSGGYLYSKSKKQIIQSIPIQNFDFQSLQAIQQLKAMDLSSFFKHRKN